MLRTVATWRMAVVPAGRQQLRVLDGKARSPIAAEKPRKLGAACPRS